jgi:hypothetical protein
VTPTAKAETAPQISLPQLVANRFGKLSQAERRLVSAAADGGTADCTNLSGDDKNIRGDLLSWLCTNPDASAQVIRLFTSDLPGPLAASCFLFIHAITHCLWHPELGTCPAATGYGFVRSSPVNAATPRGTRIHPAICNSVATTDGSILSLHFTLVNSGVPISMAESRAFQLDQMTTANGRK